MRVNLALRLACIDRERGGSSFDANMHLMQWFNFDLTNILSGELLEAEIPSGWSGSV